MTEIIILIGCVIFFYIGKYSQTNKESEVIRSIKKRKRPKAGVLPFKSEEEFTKEAIADSKLEKSSVWSKFKK